MARRKRTSVALEKAERRASGISSIDSKLNLGNGMDLPSFWKEIEDVHEKEKQYNSLLSSVDQAYNDLLDAEKKLSEKSENMLNAVAIVYGRNSSEYEMAGGKRRSERRRSRLSHVEANVEVEAAV